MDKKLLDLYSDYLLASCGPVTATGLSSLVDGRLSHDQITRFLSGPAPTAKAWWLLIKPLVRRGQGQDAVLIIDDTIIEKPYTDEKDIVCWHFDRSKGRNVKGINAVSALYRTGELSLPAAFARFREAGENPGGGRAHLPCRPKKDVQLPALLAISVAQQSRLRVTSVIT